MSVAYLNLRYKELERLPAGRSDGAVEAGASCGTAGAAPSSRLPGDFRELNHRQQALIERLEVMERQDENAETGETVHRGA